MKTTRTNGIYETPRMEAFEMITEQFCEIISSGGVASGGTGGDEIEECSFLIP